MEQEGYQITFDLVKEFSGTHWLFVQNMMLLTAYGAIMVGIILWLKKIIVPLSLMYLILRLNGDL